MRHSPATRKDLTDLVRQWHEEGTAWVPSGLGSRLHWGPPTHGNPAGLSCRGLKRVIDHAVDDLTITVEAGLPLQELQSLLAAQGQWLPVDWPRQTDSNQMDSAGTIGGLVARGLAGGLRHRHLAVRDQIIGIGLVRPDGTTARAGGRVVKNVAGYDLMRLLCGSWGSLSLITELTLRVQPIRPAHAGLLLKGPLADLEACRAAALNASLTPERCDWRQQEPGHWQLQVQVSSVSDQAVEDQLSRLEALAEHHRLSAERHACDAPLSLEPTPGALHWLVRAVLPPASVHYVLSSPEMQALQGWSWDLAAGAGCGDGWQPATLAPSSPQAVLALRRKIASMGGTLTVLQQPKDATQRVDAWIDAPAKAVIQAVKRQFDPKGQLSPGRLPGVAG